MPQVRPRLTAIGRKSAYLLLVLWAVASPPAFAQGTAETGAQWLAVIHGQMVAVDDDRIVVEAYPNIIAFTDRPQRDVTLVDLEDFVEAAWGDDGFFVDDPPKAALASAIRDDLDTTIIEMTNVVLDHTQMTISMIPLDGDMPIVGDQIVLFIDGFPSVGGIR